MSTVLPGVEYRNVKSPH